MYQMDTTFEDDTMDRVELEDELRIAIDDPFPLDWIAEDTWEERDSVFAD